MTVTIKSVNIEKFRGILDLELELEGRSLLLKGENGTGKSSVIDAIEFFFTGEVSHLKGIQKLNLHRHGPHVDFTPDDVRVTITFNPGTVPLSRTFFLEPNPPDLFRDYFMVAQSGSFILRRSQILEFIVCRPADRFRVIGNMMGVASLDETELNMMKLRDRLKSERESRQDRIGRLLQDLSGILGGSITESQSILPALNKKLGENGFPPIGSLEEDYTYVEEVYMQAKRKDDSSGRIKVLDEILDLAKSSAIREELVGRIEELNVKIEEYGRNEERQKVDQSLVSRKFSC